MKSYTESVFTIPNLVTLLNLISGLISIYFIIYDNYPLAYLLILLAAFFDAIDGLVARKLGQESNIGCELDSLADIVSFGASPAILILKQASLNPLYLIPAAFFISCGALRLARFNLYGTKEFFEGLPIPAAAIFAASTAIYMIVEITGWVFFLIGVLMISSVIYPSIKTMDGRKSVVISLGIGFLLFFFLAVISPELMSRLFVRLEAIGIFLAILLFYLSLSYALISPLVFYGARGKAYYRSVRLQNVRK